MVPIIETLQNQKTYSDSSKTEKGVFARHFRGICVGTITVGPTAHLRWIADALKLAQNPNRIGAIFNYAISKYRIAGESSC